ncbi:MAG: DUF1465 family protein [Sphingobium sp.]
MPFAAALEPGLHRRLVDSLYVEAMVMADEARSYFDGGHDSDTISDPLRRVAYTCESLKITTRLMHVIAWLLSQRAWQRGEIMADDLAEDRHRLGAASRTDLADVADLPFAVRALIGGSQDLYDRVARLQDRLDAMTLRGPLQGRSPAHALMDRLLTAF